MKVLFYIEGMIVGGKERRLTELMKSLKRKSDIQFELVVMTEDIQYKEIFDLDIKIHYLIRNSKKDISIFKKFYKICKKYKPDLVHCWDSMTAVYSIPVCKLLGIKLVNGMVTDTPMPQNMSNVHWLRARFTFPFSNIIVGNSEAGLAGYRAPKKKSVCIYNGIDLRRFENLKDPAVIRKEIIGDSREDVFIAGMVAKFEDRKDHPTLIKAAVDLVSRHDSIRFILVGDGEEFTKVKKTVLPGLLDKIIFTGRRSDIETIVNIFDVGLLLTNNKVHGEGISNSIVEYMTLSKPVIATTGGGTNEIVINNENGFLIDAERGDQLIEKIEKLMADKNLRDYLGENGSRLVHAKFDLNVMMEQFILTYRRLLN